ncbi:MAG TPA: helix-turn-helix transcriptional regulator, partial [Puia sp.]|nr:helix-turn-helix transcriptional regulator [Puia sp.]
MILRELPSPLALADTISGITVLQADRLRGEWSIPLVARAAPSIVYQSTAGSAQLVLYGQNVRPFALRASGHLTMIAWFLHPHRLGPLFGFRASEVTEICVDLGSLPLVRRLSLVERLGESGEVRECLELMQEFIRPLCAAATGGVNDAAGYATGVLRGGNGLVSLRSLQEELRITERSFQRLFDLHIGVSPKQYSRICQFQPAFRQLSGGQFGRLSDIAYDNGYADQSHLIRVFREFTGLTPKE